MADSLDKGNAAIVQVPGAVFHSHLNEYAERPCCCVSTGADVVNLTEQDIIFSKRESICNLPMHLGAGYTVFLSPLRKVLLWNSASSKSFCGSPTYSVGIVTTSGASVHSKLAPRSDGKYYISELKRNMATVRGLDFVEETTDFKAGSVIESKTLKVGATGDVVLVHNRMGCCGVNEDMEGGFLQDMQYIRYTQTSTLGEVFCGYKNRIEVQLNCITLDLPLPHHALPKAHQAIMDSLRGGATAGDDTLAKFTTGKSEAVITPQFVTVRHTTATGFGLCTKVESTTVLAASVAYMTARLPSWHKALLKAVRDIELAAMAATCYALCWKDQITLCMGNPLPMCVSFYTIVILMVKAMMTVLAFFRECLGRRTSVIFGGAGPVGELPFPPEEHPEMFLGMISAKLSEAVLLGNGATAPGRPPANGAAKLIEVAPRRVEDEGV